MHLEKHIHQYRYINHQLKANLRNKIKITEIPQPKINKICIILLYDGRQWKHYHLYHKCPQHHKMVMNIPLLILKERPLSTNLFVCVVWIQILYCLMYSSTLPICSSEARLKNMGKHVNGLAQDCSNSIAYALELLQSCTKSLIL